MALLLRWALITVLLVRITTGSTWAMPMPETASNDVPPCHGMQPHTPASKQDEGLHSSAPVCDTHCALCYVLVSTDLTLPLASTRHSMPAAPMVLAFHWQRAPELRPPI